MKGAIIKSIILSNELPSAAATIQLKIRPGNGDPARYIAPKDLTIPNGLTVVIDAVFTLSLASPEDKIIAWTDASTINGISYVINGMERDQ